MDNYLNENTPKKKLKWWQIVLIIIGLYCVFVFAMALGSGSNDGYTNYLPQNSGTITRDSAPTLRRCLEDMALDELKSRLTDPKKCNIPDGESLRISYTNYDGKSGVALIKGRVGIGTAAGIKVDQDFTIAFTLQSTEGDKDSLFSYKMISFDWS